MDLFYSHFPISSLLDPSRRRKSILHVRVTGLPILLDQMRTASALPSSEMSDIAVKFLWRKSRSEKHRKSPSGKVGFLDIFSESPTPPSSAARRAGPPPKVHHSAPRADDDGERLQAEAAAGLDSGRALVIVVYIFELIASFFAYASLSPISRAA